MNIYLINTVACHIKYIFVCDLEENVEAGDCFVKKLPSSICAHACEFVCSNAFVRLADLKPE